MVAIVQLVRPGSDMIRDVAGQAGDADQIKPPADDRRRSAEESEETRPRMGNAEPKRTVRNVDFSRIP